MTVSSVASLRPAPTMAVYGLACVFLYVLPAIIFLIPTALVSAELASGWSGGVFRWVTEGMSPRMGFVAAWHQYAMTIFYYPTTRPVVLRGQHAGLCHPPGVGVQRSLDRRRHHLGLLARHASGPAGAALGSSPSWPPVAC
jgi:hypothetical protein